ncbi:hypothetical protein [Rhizobium leguminosarum]|nr:hypothetical protein [Rhizobium leguminosarum]
MATKYQPLYRRRRKKAGRSEKGKAYREGWKGRCISTCCRSLVTGDEGRTTGNAMQMMRINDGRADAGPA